MNRGSSVSMTAPSLWRPCFNEAPIHESGKSYQLRQNPRIHQGFNEAPIHESGKFHPCHPTASRSPCFNEAPIHESGKCISSRRN